MEITGPRGNRWPDVEVASTLRARWRGLMARPVAPLLIRTRTVHGFWLRGDLQVVGIDPHGVVSGVRLLRRRRVVMLAGACWTLELPLDHPRPRPGDRLTFRPTDGEPDIHVRPSLSVRHSHREPG